jgi:hypothetical protein
MIHKAFPHLEWIPKPLPFMYVGKPLKRKTCNAQCLSKDPHSNEDITGKFVYCPPPGEVLELGEHTLTVIFQPHDQYAHNYTFASKWIVFPVIEVNSLYKLPKRYTEPEPRPEYNDDREYLLCPMKVNDGKFIYSDIDTVAPSAHDRRVMEAREKEKNRKELMLLKEEGHMIEDKLQHKGEKENPSSPAVKEPR